MMMHARIFKSRREAGRELATTLRVLSQERCVVAAIPRGGVVVALPISERLGVPLTVSYARKLTDPSAPELAFGSLDEDGHAIVDASTVARLGLAPVDVERAKARVGAEIQRRIERYHVPVLRRLLPASRVIIVDDGLATGLTMRAAVAYARRHGAGAVTIAVPCASAQAARAFRKTADQVVSLVVDDDFKAIGDYYAEFAPVPDDEVVRLLARAAEHLPNHPRDAGTL
jgi:predicted phosphoribosyltransferase